MGSERMTLPFETDANDGNSILDKFEGRLRRGEDGASDRTVEIYKRRVRNWKDWLEKNRDKSLWEAEYEDLDFKLRDMEDEGKAPSTRKLYVSAVSRFYQACDKMSARYEMPTVPDNPYDEFDKADRKSLKGDTKKKQKMDKKGGDQFPYISPKQVEKLVENVPAPRLRNEMIIKLLFRCGFRREELAQCKRNNVKRDNKSVYIPPMKSEEPRSVSYNASYLSFHLSQWLDHGKRSAVTGASESEYLLPTQNQEHIGGARINRIVKQAADNAGIQDTVAEYSDGRKQHLITAHTLRHSFAMNAIDSGIHVKTLQTLMGHEELDTTLIYLQQSKDEALEKSRAIDPTPHR